MNFYDKDDLKIATFVKINASKLKFSYTAIVIKGALNPIIS